MSPKYQDLFWKIMEWGLTNPYYSVFEQIQRNQAGIAYKGYQLPEPWNGDIENADVIFVGLNPSYNPEEFNPHDVSIDPNSYWAAQKGRNVKVINGIGYNKQRIEDFFENRFSGEAVGFESIANRKYQGGTYKYESKFDGKYRYVSIEKNDNKKVNADFSFRVLLNDTTYSASLPYWQYCAKLFQCFPMAKSIEDQLKSPQIGKDYAFLEIIPCKSQGSDGLAQTIGGTTIQEHFIDSVFKDLLSQLCKDKHRIFVILGKDKAAKVFHKILQSIDKNFPSIEQIWSPKYGYQKLGKALRIDISNNVHKVIFWSHPTGRIKEFTDEKWSELRNND